MERREATIGIIDALLVRFDSDTAENSSSKATSLNDVADSATDSRLVGGGLGWGTSFAVWLFGESRASSGEVCVTDTGGGLVAGLTVIKFGG